MKLNKGQIISLIVILVLILDQASKIWVKTNMYYGEQISIFGASWGFIHFVENNGMAFGISLGGKFGKLVLSLFRIGAVGFLIYFIRKMIEDKQKMGVLICFALILAGAIGNIIDSAFYGLIFSESPYHGGVATMFPEGGGYASFLYGKVVDMLYFPLIDTHWPSWMPFISGDRFQFFKPVFNVADSSISVGIVSLLLFQRSFFAQPAQTSEQKVVDEAAEAPIPQESPDQIEPT
ncbi:MAG: lipoprotein signal peptidase [Saprospiraceae bacterium]|nr:lipoprotein signal peptidase [Saprospiraceae bacterium]